MTERETLINMLKEIQSGEKKQIKGAAKWITLSILIITFIIGIIGAFNVSRFSMEDYVLFIESFAWFFAPLVLSIGAGSASAKISDALKTNKENKDNA